MVVRAVVEVRGVGVDVGMLGRRKLEQSTALFACLSLPLDRPLRLKKAHRLIVRLFFFLRKLCA